MPFLVLSPKTNLWLKPTAIKKEVVLLVKRPTMAKTNYAFYAFVGDMPLLVLPPTNQFVA